MKNYHNIRDNKGRFAPKTAQPKKTSRRSKAKKVGRVLIGLVLDESGSMSGVTKATQNGYNQYIEELSNSNKNVETLISLVRFRDSDDIKVSFENVTIGGHCKIYDYLPYAGTPLYDSIAKCIGILDRTYKQGDAVILTIFTDGDENASVEYSKRNNGQRRIKDLILERRDGKNWMINFIGCGEDQIVKKTSADLGIFMQNTKSYSGNTDENLKGIFGSVSINTVTYSSNYASTGTTSNIGFFSDEN